jgi:hypothetical protein
VPNFHALDANGDPLSGGKVYTYTAGTANLKTTYSDAALTAANANPVVLDSRGEALIYGSGSYKIVLKDSADTTIYTVDNVDLTGNTSIVDADNDTKIQVEEAADEDIIRFDTAGTQRATLDSTGLTLASGLKIIVGTDDLTALAVPGLAVRGKFSWKDADEIYIEPFTYHHDGTKEQLVYADLQLTFQFGSGGSNAGSQDLTGLGPDFIFVYLDDSAIVTAATNLIAAGQLVANNTAPTWTVGKHGWYNGSDRAIFAVYIDGSDNVIEFMNYGDLVMLADHLAGGQTTKFDFDYTTITQDHTTWDDVYLPSPDFCTRHLLTAVVEPDDVQLDKIVWRQNGQAGSTGHIAVSGGTAGIVYSNQFDAISDNSQIIEVKATLSTANDPEVSIYLDGWYLPNGM